MHLRVQVSVASLGWVLACCGGGGGGASRDSGIGHDATPTDGPALRCSTSSVDLVCHGSIVTGRAAELDLLVYGDCFCGHSLRCNARIASEGERRLDLDFELCTSGDEAACTACLPEATGRCSLPPLAAGRWRVRVGGLDAFELNVAPAEVSGGSSTCVRPARTAAECPPVWPGEPWAAQEACFHTPRIAERRLRITFRDPCAPCGYLGPCITETDVNTRTVRVLPNLLRGDGCPVCAAVCMPIEYWCESAPLPAGDYRVIIADPTGREGMLMVSERPADEREVCLPGPAPVGP
ncbi:MAG: hypothetical protein NZ898_04795 [Myxococcota bacterium]|nr:hypothetical protein [Myxococcota bacterium]MDW8361503.1 hypothetical protein [Myxococcales bacterium]